MQVEDQVTMLSNGKAWQDFKLIYIYFYKTMLLNISRIPKLSKLKHAILQIFKTSN